MVPVVILMLFLSGTASGQVDSDDYILGPYILNGITCNPLSEMYIAHEGSALEICPLRKGVLNNFPLIIALTGINHKTNADFVTNDTVLESGQPCALIETVDDNDIEQIEYFLISLTIRELPGISPALCTAVIIDNDGLNTECRDIHLVTHNGSQTSKPSSCSPSINLDRCTGGSSKFSLECSRLNGSDVPSLLANHSTITSYFTNINPEMENSFCIEFVRQNLLLKFGNLTDSDNGGANDQCYTNCSVTFSGGCIASILYLERINFRRISDISSGKHKILSECGSLEISCCSDPLPEFCHSSTDGFSTATLDAKTNQVTVVLIGGVVGGVVGLALIILAVLLLALLACFITRRKKRSKRRTTSSGHMQSVMYKPKTASSVVSSISQDSTVPITTPLAQDNSMDSTVSLSQPVVTNYEQVAYADSEPYSQWKVKFAKVLIDSEQLEYGSMIGEGEFSNVSRAKYTSIANESPMPVAVKKLKDVSDNYEIEKFISESEVMLGFDHQNILGLVGVCFNMADTLPAIILPYMGNGDLRKFLTTRREELKYSKERYPKDLSEAVLLRMCMDVARGMHYLAKCKLVHRDLAARNCMVDDEMRVKVADFGLSRDIQDTDFYKLTHRQKLPVKWMALESLFKNLFTEKSDVWSYGIVCWEIFKMGKKPYTGIDNQELPDLISHGFRLKKPSRCPSAMYEIMRDAWIEDPTERPNFKSVISSLASVMRYDGDIDEDLRRETTNCVARHKYHQVQIPIDNQTQQEAVGYYNINGGENIYSVPAEPIYTNFSQEEELFEAPMEYEVPVPTSQTSEAPIIPVDYEIPQPKIERWKKDENKVDSSEGISSSPCHQPTPPPAYSPPAYSPHRSPSHHSLKSIKIPLSDPSMNQEPQKGSNQEPSKRLPPYSKLSYQITSSDSSTSCVPLPNSMPTLEKQYSALEWNSGQGNASNSKSHLYHTLEYSQSCEL